MKLLLLSVGKTRGLMADVAGEYETRLRRYFPYEAAEVREEPFRRGSGTGQVLEEEGRRLLARVPAGAELVALHRGGSPWSSERLAEYLGQLAVQGSAGATFLVGGAFGLSQEVLGRATHLLSLSSFTLPHEMARLVLIEQLYRAATILRGEPYHKGSAAAVAGESR